MIPTIENIIEGLMDGSYTKEQAIAWLEVHASGPIGDLRDDFASKAMQSLIGNPTITSGLREPVPLNAFDETARGAYLFANAMLKERAK